MANREVNRLRPSAGSDVWVRCRYPSGHFSEWTYRIPGESNSNHCHRSVFPPVYMALGRIRVGGRARPRQNQAQEDLRPSSHSGHLAPFRACRCGCSCDGAKGGANHRERLWSPARLDGATLFASASTETAPSALIGTARPSKRANSPSAPRTFGANWPAPIWPVGAHPASRATPTCSSRWPTTGPPTPERTAKRQRQLKTRQRQA